MSAPEVIKPNDSGIDPKDAKLPVLDDAFDDHSSPLPEEMKEPAGIPPPSPEDLRQSVIAGEDRVKRRELMLTIQRYYNSRRFGKFLIEMELVEDLSTRTIAEMEASLREIRFCIQNKNTGDMIQRTVPRVIMAAEPVVSRIPGLDIRGLANMLDKDENFHDLLEEVALENQMMSNTPAIHRLSACIAMGALQVSGVRWAMKKAAEAQAQVDAEKAAAGTPTPAAPAFVSAATQELLGTKE